MFSNEPKMIIVLCP